ncbi:MAG: hypothetical protein AAF586_08760, partial [Planctomycetota bacterium]
MRSTTALAVVLVLPACTAQPVSPATVAADTQRSVEARARAVASLATLEDPDSLALLRELAWSPRTPAPIGTAAISALADRSPGVTMADAAERLDDLDRWPVLEAAVAAASRCVANGSPSDATRVALAAAAARSLARPSARYHDAQRPELELLLAATEAATAESALLGLVDPDAATERHTTLGDRAAAWTAYHRRVGPERARVAAERFAGDA